APHGIYPPAENHLRESLIRSSSESAMHRIAAKNAHPCPLWVKSGHSLTSNQCPLYPQKRTSELTRGMSALCQKRTSPGDTGTNSLLAKLQVHEGSLFPVRWRNVFDRNYVAFQALLDLCHSVLWLVCRCLPCAFATY